MQLYTNNVQDRNGNAVSGAQVLVLKDGGAATIYSDNAGTVMPNPTQTDADGEFRFYAISGRYSLTITSPRLPEAIEFPGIVLFDPDDLGNDLDAIEIVANNIDSVVTVAENISSVLAVEANEANINTLAAIDSDVTAVGAVAASVSTVAGISADVTAVAGISANVTTVAGISGDVTTVATNSANVTTVATNVANVNTVGGDIADVTTVATNIADVTALAAEIPAFASFAKLATAQNFTAPQRSAILTDNDGSFDLSAKQNFKCTTAGAVTLTFTNQADGLSGSVIFINSSNHTVSAHANTKLTAADLAKLSVTGTYRIDYLSDGTNAYCSVTGAFA